MFLLLSSKYYIDIETPFTVINIVIEQILRCYRNKKNVITLKFFNVIVTKPCYRSEIDNPDTHPHVGAPFIILSGEHHVS